MHSAVLGWLTSCGYFTAVQEMEDGITVTLLPWTLTFSSLKEAGVRLVGSISSSKVAKTWEAKGTFVAFSLGLTFPVGTEGRFLSTLLPAMGPACVEWPSASKTVRVLVWALSVSVSAGTFVDSEKLASEVLAKPEPLSLAVQLMLTSLTCHRPSAALQLTSGAVVSSLSVGHND